MVHHSLSIKIKDSCCVLLGNVEQTGQLLMHNGYDYENIYLTWQLRYINYVCVGPWSMLG